MSSNYYCDSDSLKHSFSELCPVAKFRIMIQLLYVPVIVVGNILTMATIKLLKQLHSPREYVLFAISVSDLIIEIVICPLYMLKVFPETGFIIGSSMWACKLIYFVRTGMDFLEFDLLTLMCIDRFVMIKKPIWYRNHVTRRKMIVAMFSIILLRTVLVVAWAVSAASEHNNEDWSVDTCLTDTFVRACMLHTANTSLFVVEILLRSCLCIWVIVTTLRRYKRRRSSIV